jgi:hypothetical protein
MDCVHNYVYLSTSKVCRLCGIEKRVLYLDQYSKYSAPLNRGYDRNGRMKIKLQKLFGLHSGPKAEDAVWEKLRAVRHELHTPKHVRKKLRSFSLRNKHYDCTRIFTDTFTDFRVHVPHAQRLRERILHNFLVIHSSWRTHTPNEAFFSYDFLLRYLLEEEKCSLIVYCKPKTSKRRRKNYLEKLRVIQARSGYKMWSRKPAVTHSRNVLESSWTPLSLPQSGVGPYESGVAAPPTRTEGPTVCPEPCPTSNSERGKGGSVTLTDASSHARKAYQAYLRGRRDSGVGTCASRRET